MRILGIYGASGLGREVLELARIINKTEKIWDDYIFIDDGNVPEFVGNVKVYKYEEAKAEFGLSVEIVIGIGEPSTREKIFNKLKHDQINTPSLVHPEVHIPDSTVIGQGTVIQYGCFVSCNVFIGDYVYLQPHCNIGHDCYLDEGAMVSGFGNLGGAVRVGKHTYIGLGSSIIELAHIGNYAVVGMGSIVFKDVPDEMIAMGNPARCIRKNEFHRVFDH